MNANKKKQCCTLMSFSLSRWSFHSTSNLTPPLHLSPPFSDNGSAVNVLLIFFSTTIKETDGQQIRINWLLWPGDWGRHGNVETDAVDNHRDWSFDWLCFSSNQSINIIYYHNCVDTVLVTNLQRVISWLCSSTQPHTASVLHLLSI